MAKKKKKDPVFYAVKMGVEPGIFDAWEKCRQQVAGFPGAEYKKFLTWGEAVAWLGPDYAFAVRASRNRFTKKEKQAQAPRTPKKKQEKKASSKEDPPLPKITSSKHMLAYVDGSYQASPPRIGYGLLVLTQGRQRHLSGGSNHSLLLKSRNVSGEVLAAQWAIELALEEGMTQLTIYHDYTGIEFWATGDWQAKNPLTQAYRDYAQEAQKHLNLRFVKVKAHSGNAFNDLADQLAKEGAAGP